MKSMRWITLILIASSVAAAAGRKAKAKKMDFNKLDPATVRATLKTDMGDITLRFFPDKAPNHVRNFIELAQAGLYDGVLFHRVIPDFMIQTGDPLTKDPKTPKDQMGTGSYVVPASEKEAGAGFLLTTARVPMADGTWKTVTVRNVKAEFNDISHKRGIVSMARSNDPNSASCQFFIVVKDSTYLDRQYTAFGEVVSGMEVADKIAVAQRDKRDNPVSPIRIQKVVLSQEDAGAAKH